MDIWKKTSQSRTHGVFWYSGDITSQLPNPILLKRHSSVPSTEPWAGICSLSDARESDGETKHKYRLHFVNMIKNTEQLPY